MGFLIPCKSGAYVSEACLKRLLTEYMRSGRVYCIIWRIFSGVSTEFS